LFLLEVKMKSTHVLLVILAVLTLMTGNLFAQGEAAAEFLLIAPGARAGGIGEANVATILRDACKLAAAIQPGRHVL